MEKLKFYHYWRRFVFFYHQQKLGISFLLLLSFVAQTSYASVLNVTFSSLELEEKTVYGKVISSEDNLGLPGVTVLEKGTTNGTVTDADGGFRLSVDSDASVLVFSSIGFNSQEVAVGNQSEINITLEVNIEQLSEVVVIGYGSQGRAEITSAIGSVKGDAISQRGTVNPLQGIQGQVAGVDISAASGRAGTGFNIQIRGQNSLAGGGPLYVVDGVLVGGIDFLNPNDIESIDILKDAASTAVFGSRGSNGVVMVTTKGGTGVKGSTHISYEGYVGVRQNARMPDFMGGDDWWEYRQNAFITPELLAGRGFDNTIGGLAVSPTLARRVANREYTDWQNILLQTGIQTNHWLNVSGTGNNGMNYVIGAGYQNEKGNISRESYDRFNFKASVDHKINENWSAGMSFNISLVERELGSDLAITNAYRMSPLVSPYDEEGNLVFRPGQFDALGFTSSVNPLIDNENADNNMRRTFGIGNIYLQYSPVSWLQVRSTFAPRIKHERTGRYFGSLTEARGEQLPSARMNRDESFSYNWDNQITANKSFGDHHFTLTGLHSVWFERNEFGNIEANNLPFNSSFYNLGSGPRDQLVVGSGFSQLAIISYMARLNYNYKDKFLFTAVTRADGSSKLAPGYQWANFPSASIGYRLSEEPFMKDISFLDDLKARLSFGFAGNNNNISPYGTQANLSSPLQYDFGGQLGLGYVPNRITNELLTWEKSREINAGLDYTLFRGRVTGTIDVYNKLSDGLLLSRALPRESGWGSITANIGSVRNKGVELGLTTVNVSTRDLVWTTTFNFARNRNAIEELINGKEDMIGNAWFIGQPIDVNYTFVFDGIWQESEREMALSYGQLPGQARVVDLNDDGVINGDDRAIIGNPVPSWTGGFSTNLTYKNFDFNLSLFSRQGIQVRSPFHAEFLNWDDRGRSKLNVDYYMPENGVTPARSSNTYPQPRNGGPHWGAVRDYVDASFVKIQNISLGYTVPQDFLGRYRIQSLRLYTNVTNPFVWTPYEGFDPEWASAGLGSSGNSFITYQFGLNVKF